MGAVTGVRRAAPAVAAVTAGPAGPAAARGYAPGVQQPAGRQVAVSTSAQLTAALAAARPGDTTTLADGRYTGRTGVDGRGAEFAARTPGTAAAPVTLVGSRRAVIDGGDVRKRYGSTWPARPGGSCPASP